LILAIEPQNQKCLATQLLKLFIFGHLMVLVGGFADVDATWQWDPPVSILSLSSLSSLSFFFLISSLPTAGDHPRDSSGGDAQSRPRSVI
jgi:hypothetical protein